MEGALRSMLNYKIARISLILTTCLVIGYTSLASLQKVGKIKQA